MNFSLEQVMTELPRTVPARASVKEAHGLMVQHGIRHLPVEENGTIVGVLSDRDVNLALTFNGGASPVSVFTVCSKPAYMVEKGEPITLVLRTLAENGYGCVLVTDRSRLIGIVTTSDLLRWTAARLEQEAA